MKFIIEMIRAAWERAGKPMNQNWLPAISHGDEPLLIVVAQYAQKLEKRIKELEEEFGDIRIKLRCDACGEAEHCDTYCELTTENITDVDDILCPLTGDETEWYVVKGGQTSPKVE